jgi:hypothetical protein
VLFRRSSSRVIISRRASIEVTEKGGPYARPIGTRGW